MSSELVEAHIQKYLETICVEHGYYIPNNKWNIQLDYLLYLVANNLAIVSNITSKYRCSKGTVTKLLKLTFPDRVLPIDTNIRAFLLRKKNKKYCPKCKEIEDLENFYFKNNTSSGYMDCCKNCSKQSRKDYYKRNSTKEITRVSTRKHDKLGRIPPWADLSKIEEIYLNCPKGYHVDHIYPLNNPNCSGLHVENNLQYLKAEENLKNGNKLP